jgi:hypothetical protein
MAELKPVIMADETPPAVKQHSFLPEKWPPWKQPKYRRTIRASAMTHGRRCPGSVYLGQAKLMSAGEHEGTKYTQVGTIGHRWLELMLNKRRTEANEYLNEVQATDDFRLTLAELWGWLHNAKFCPAFDASADAVSLNTERTMIPFAVGDDLKITGSRDVAVVQGKTAWVLDWKFYNDPSMLPPIGEDLQMHAYAVGTWKEFPFVEKIIVQRILCYYFLYDVMELDISLLNLSEKVLGEEAGKIWTRRDQFVLGAHCLPCLQRDHCQAWRDQHKNVATPAGKPYTGGDFSTETEALQFLISAPALEALIAEGKAAAQRWVTEHGKNIADSVSCKDWGPRETNRDAIINVLGCVGEMAKKVGKERATGAVSLTKGAIETALKAGQVPPKERKRFIEDLRGLGYMQIVEKDPMWMWKKI